MRMQKVTKAKFFTVTPRAAIQRINRKLAHDGEKLVTTRGARNRQNLGEYFILDESRNCVIATHCDIEKLGREIGVIEKWEKMEADE